jgi:hypothetical protein
VSEKDYKDGHEEDLPLECELQDVDMNGTGYKKICLSGLTTNWAQENQVISGFSTFSQKTHRSMIVLEFLTYLLVHQLSYAGPNEVYIYMSI